MIGPSLRLCWPSSPSRLRCDGSMMVAGTLRSSPAQAAARFAATVVLATPPLPLATATACWLGADDLLQLVCRRGISSLRS